MPLIKILHVYSSSSEDPNAPAENLLSEESYRKWSCAEPGEKKAVVILQLEKSTSIHALDIGNNGSAFVEVLVGHSSSPEDYQVLLSMSTFMSVPESKQWLSHNRVRMFGKEKFTKEVAAKKWDRVKVVCTQPYNKSMKYGLSFIKLHSPPEPAETTPTSAAPTTAPVPTKLGGFALKEEAKDLPSGSLFFKKGPLSSPPGKGTGTGKVVDTPNAAAQARMASAAALKAISASSPPSSAPGPQAASPMLAHPHKTTAPPVSSHHHHKAASLQSLKVGSLEGGGGSSQKTGGTAEERGGAGDNKRPMTTAHTATPASKKAAVESEKGKAVVVSVPFSRLLEGVVFVLSGFKNPLRNTVRTKGLDMGAVYKADWGPSCTHLVCAFPNTPKFNQVKGKGGLIVCKEWLLDCHAKKRRLPARRYRLSSGAGDSSSSEDERYDTREATIFKTTPTATPTSSTTSMSVSGGGEKEGEGHGEEGQRSPQGGVGVAGNKEDNLDELYDASTDEDDVVVKGKPPASSARYESSEEVDTEDEIQRVREEQRNHGNAVATNEDPYDVSTDEEMEPPPTSSHFLANLPDFLSKATCFLYGEFSHSDRKLLTRYVTAYGGHVVDYMSDKVTHVLTMENWDENFDQALTDNSTLAFVRPAWIFECHVRQQCVPYHPFEVSPR